jgi:hypothetical protein
MQKFKGEYVCVNEYVYVRVNQCEYVCACD